jgi:hypothetical protein
LHRTQQLTIPYRGGHADEEPSPHAGPIPHGAPATMRNGEQSLGCLDGLEPEDPIDSLLWERADKSLVRVLHEELGVDAIRDLVAIRELPAAHAGALTPAQRLSFSRLMERALAVCARSSPEENELDDPTQNCVASPGHPARSCDHEADQRPETDRLTRALAMAYSLVGARTLADVLRPEVLDLIGTCDEGLAGLPIIDLAAGAVAELDICSAVMAALATLSPRERLLLERGVLSATRGKPTLADLGSAMGISRERVRQLRNVAERQFSGATAAAMVPWRQVFRGRLAVVVRQTTAFNLVASSVSDLARSETRLVVSAILWSAGYELGNDWLVRDGDSGCIELLVERIRSVVAKDRFLSNATASELCSDMLDFSRDGAAFIEEIANLVPFRDGWIRNDSARAKVEAALMLLGRPATRAEIADVSGVAEAGVGKYCSALPDVCRSGKESWGLSSWVQEPYEGIAAEIRKRIERGNGAIEIGHLLAELPNRYGVSESSVLAFIHGTARFVADEGRVRLATDAEIDSKHFGEVEDLEGAVPLGTKGWGWALVVEERYFRGYSAGVPFAIAAAAGLAPGDSKLVRAVGTPYEVSLIWRVDTASRAVDVGRIAPVLSAIGAKAGSEIVLILSPTSVEFLLPASIGREPKPTTSSTGADVDSLLDTLFSVRP